MDTVEGRHAFIRSISESDELKQNVARYYKRSKSTIQKNDVLKNLDLFVLDNSLRETTVGAFRGHTVEDKWSIYNEVKKVGLKHILVESFNRMNRLGEPFLREMIKNGEDISKMYAFSEVFELEKGIPQDDIPIGLQKMKEFGIQNPVLELDLVNHEIDYDVVNEERICEILLQRFQWIRENLSPNALIFLNFRDFFLAFEKKPERVLFIVRFLSSLPKEKRIFGIAYEDLGSSLPEDMNIWTQCVRDEMNQCGWKTGHLIIHVHEQFGLGNQVVLDCLRSGATGIWCAVCEEGAAIGHISSCLTIINLIRMGNKKVLKKFDCKYIRTASRVVTEITTGKPPHPRQPIVGERVFDVWLTLNQSMQGKMDFNLADFVEAKKEIRITTLASPDMISSKLKELFGDHKNFTDSIAQKMKELMLEDLAQGRKEEYHSSVGLALLYDRAGGKLTPEVSDKIEKEKLTHYRMQGHIYEIRKVWDDWDLRDGVMDDQLDFTSFYNAFMIPYFGCYMCEDTKKALSAIDMDSDGTVDWKEFLVYLKWAAHQYPDTETPEELLSIAFRKGVIPAMQDELVKILPPATCDMNDVASTDDVLFSAYVSCAGDVVSPDDVVCETSKDENEKKVKKVFCNLL